MVITGIGKRINRIENKSVLREQREELWIEIDRLYRSSSGQDLSLAHKHARGFFQEHANTLTPKDLALILHEACRTERIEASMLSEVLVGELVDKVGKDTLRSLLSHLCYASTQVREEHHTRCRRMGRALCEKLGPGGLDGTQALAVCCSGRWPSAPMIGLVETYLGPDSLDEWGMALAQCVEQDHRELIDRFLPRVQHEPEYMAGPILAACQEWMLSQDTKHLVVLFLDAIAGHKQLIEHEDFAKAVAFWWRGLGNRQMASLVAGSEEEAITQSLFERMSGEQMTKTHALLTQDASWVVPFFEKAWVLDQKRRIGAQLQGCGQEAREAAARKM